MLKTEVKVKKGGEDAEGEAEQAEETEEMAEVDGEAAMEVAAEYFVGYEEEDISLTGGTGLFIEVRYEIW